MRLDIGGYVCIVRDTAGLRANTQDSIEQEGIQRAYSAYAQAQVKVMVADASSEDARRESVERLGGLMKGGGAGRGEGEDEVEGDDGEEDRSQYLLVVNKKDITPIKEADIHILTQSILPSNISSSSPLSTYLISCTTGEGLAQLEEGILKAIQAYLNSPPTNPTQPTATNNIHERDESLYITRERHRRHVRRCVEHLDRFLFEHLSMDMAAEEIRLVVLCMDM
ncbi:hypothetical protein EON65_39210 [archaeon]|nr:MAG: hypothetical protein EON65_39210 [archaeon]